MKQLFPLLFAPLLLNAQIEYLGSIHPSNLYRISDGSEISLPFRLVDMELDYTWRNFDFKTRWAIETRWSDPQFTSNLREAYLVWYPAFGEVKLGKQIFAWGAADGNNPTDNLSAYNYYYLFLQGIDRKIGSLSTAVLVYWGNWQVEMIVITKHQANQMVFDEPDFPLSQSTEYLDPRDFIRNKDKNIEYGIRSSKSLQKIDFALTIFSGRDRMFTPIGYLPWSELSPSFEFGYRKTEVFGIDMVVFPGEATIRTELGYFRTRNDYNQSDLTFTSLQEIEADYIQYVFELEMDGPFDVALMGQYIGSEVIELKSDFFDKDSFTPGMGTPFAMFADRSLLLTAGATFMDETLKTIASSFINLEEEGYMLGFTADYSPVDNWHVELGINKFVGDGKRDSNNVFNLLEDFSHFTLGLKYSF